MEDIRRVSVTPEQAIAIARDTSTEFVQTYPDYVVTVALLADSEFPFTELGIQPSEQMRVVWNITLLTGKAQRHNYIDGLTGKVLSVREWVFRNE